MANYSDPKDYMFSDPVWEAIWQEIRTWDINVPEEYTGYSGATGNHTTAIYLAITNVLEDNLKKVINGNKNIKKRL